MSNRIVMLSLVSLAACAEAGATAAETETADELGAQLTDSQRPMPADRVTVRPNAIGAPGVIAFGTINSSGTKVSGSSNWSSVVTTSGIGHYEVTITGESYFYSSYATLVTPMGLGEHVACVTDSNVGKLYISCFNTQTGAVAFPIVAFSTSKP